MEFDKLKSRFRAKNLTTKNYMTGYSDLTGNYLKVCSDLSFTCLNIVGETNQGEWSATKPSVLHF